MGVKGLRNAAIVTFVVAMAIILLGGYYAKNEIAPIPAKVVGPDGKVALMTSESIKRGQDVYQRYGLMDHGSVWGHGTLRGMDFSADTLHRMGAYMRHYYVTAGKDGPEVHALPLDDIQAADAKALRLNERAIDEQAAIDARVIREIKSNTYDRQRDVLTFNAAQAYAVGQIRKYWNDEFEKGDTRVGFLPGTIPSAQERSDIGDFFVWTAWAAGVNRPGQSHTYTSNWPADPTVGNSAPPEAIFWTIFSILALLGVLGIVVYVVHRYQFFYGEAKGVQAAYEMMRLPVTPSQRATAKFFLVAGLLFLVQILNGGLLANYTVNPGKFYIESVGKLYPYSWAKTWHVQLAILWIAVAWIGTSVYVAPIIARREPKGQRLLVNLLFAAAFLVIVGSLVGEVLSIKGLMQVPAMATLWYWLGHQGWEYLELGRLWQWMLFGGLIFWLIIVYRTMSGVMRKDAKQDDDYRALVVFYVLSAILVVAFFGFGFFYGRGTHLTLADYWRWFVVHIWVESMFEFFGVAVVALFLVALGLVTARSAIRVAYLTGILVFLSGIPGTAHHYFWFGGPSFWLAMGGVFSSLEPIPLILLVVRAWMEYRSIRQQGIEFPYRWPLYFLVASSVWNFIGAGIFGFIINLPIVNYYEHATYLTTNHAHTALFGVYGTLAISLILFSWRGLVQNRFWNDKILKLSFWGLNGGLAIMFLTTLLPVGMMQVYQTYDKGVWYSRSADFYELPAVQKLTMWRIVPDMIIIVVGALPLLYFLIATFARLRKTGQAGEETPPLP